MTFNPHTAEDRVEMMETIGITEFDQLVGAIPAGIRYPDLKLPPSPDGDGGRRSPD